MIINGGTLQRGLGYVLTVTVAACLILAWLLTSPLIRWAICATDFYHNRFNRKKLRSRPPTIARLG